MKKKGKGYDQSDSIKFATFLILITINRIANKIGLRLNFITSLNKVKYDPHHLSARRFSPQTLLFSLKTIIAINDYQ